MADVFASTPGGVLVVPVFRGTPVGISLEGVTANGSAYAVLKALITRVDMSESVARNIRASLGSMVHIYALGDRPGDMIIGGYYFWDICENTPSGSNGLTKVYNYYQTNKLTRRDTPLRVAFSADLVMRCFLRGINMGAADPQFGMGQFAFQLDYVPPQGR